MIIFGHFSRFLASFKISFSTLQHPTYDIFFVSKIVSKIMSKIMSQIFMSNFVTCKKNIILINGQKNNFADKSAKNILGYIVKFFYIFF